MPNKIRRVLWVDDDSPIEPANINGVEFRTAQTCAQASDILKDASYTPDAIIIDVVLPQAGWGSRFHLAPGIEFTRQLRRARGKALRLAVFSIALNDERKEAARLAGADVVRSKQDIGLMGLVQELTESKGSLLSRNSGGTDVQTDS